MRRGVKTGWEGGSESDNGNLKRRVGLLRTLALVGLCGAALKGLRGGKTGKAWSTAELHFPLLAEPALTLTRLFVLVSWTGTASIGAMLLPLI